MERGDPKVAMGAYAMAFFALGLGAPLEGLADPAHDEQGMFLALEDLPKRVRPRRAP